jgi:hypothetical protein
VLRALVWIGILILQGFPLLAAFEPKPAGGRNVSLGGVIVANCGECWDLFGNPSCAVGPPSAGFWFSPGLFGLPELMAVGAAAVVPLGKWGAGCSLIRFGGDLYCETEATAAVAARVHDNTSLGFSLQLYHLKIEKYGSAWSAGLSVGVSARLSSAVGVQCGASNITGASIGACREPLPQEISFGAVTFPDSSLCVVLECRKESRMPTAVTLGAEYRVFCAVSVRAGMSTETPGVSSGLGLRIGSILLDYAIQWHHQLGITHSVSISLEDVL